MAIHWKNVLLGPALSSNSSTNWYDAKTNNKTLLVNYPSRMKGRKEGRSAIRDDVLYSSQGVIFEYRQRESRLERREELDVCR